MSIWPNVDFGCEVAIFCLISGYWDTFSSADLHCCCAKNGCKQNKKIISLVLVAVNLSVIIAIALGAYHCCKRVCPGVRL